MLLLHPLLLAEPVNIEPHWNCISKHSSIDRLLLQQKAEWHVVYRSVPIISTVLHLPPFRLGIPAMHWLSLLRTKSNWAFFPHNSFCVGFLMSVCLQGTALAVGVKALIAATVLYLTLSFLTDDEFSPDGDSVSSSVWLALVASKASSVIYPKKRIASFKRSLS